MISRLRTTESMVLSLINIYKTLGGGSANETEKLSQQPGIDL
jgi:hypothetical protein